MARGRATGAKWAANEDKLLAGKIENLDIDPSRENDREYLWSVSKLHFKDFSKPNQKQNAIKRLRNKLRQWNTDQTLKGARKKKANKATNLGKWIVRSSPMVDISVIHLLYLLHIQLHMYDRGRK